MLLSITYVFKQINSPSEKSSNCRSPVVSIAPYPCIRTCVPFRTNCSQARLKNHGYCWPRFETNDGSVDICVAKRIQHVCRKITKER